MSRTRKEWVTVSGYGPFLAHMGAHAKHRARTEAIKKGVGFWLHYDGRVTHFYRKYDDRIAQRTYDKRYVRLYSHKGKVTDGAPKEAGNEEANEN